jgi:hypothetical protein
MPKSTNCETAQHFKHLVTMDIERSFMARTEGSIRESISWRDLPPTQAGLAAALRRAYALPADETDRQFEQLLQKLG